ELMTGLVSDYQQNTGALILLIEHDMSIVKSIANRVLVMHQGEVLAFGDYQDVQENRDVKLVYAGDTK
ncbi:MAG: hypothetical protein JKY49_13470, partial [Cohaesibacteraceae bacterium]|nr:hypothetical protein [Cohaesibacteraceae bacterium]